MPRTTEGNPTPAKHSTRGATSVLVIFMMMILVTLGAFAITSANANLRFSQRALGWNASYYAMDAEGEEFLADMDARLARAEAMAIDYVESGSFRSAAQNGLPLEAQIEIYNGYLAAGNLQNDYINSVIVNVYMYYADIYLQEMMGELEGMEVYTNGNGVFVDSILTQLTIKSARPKDERSSLVISTWVEPVEYRLMEEGGALTLTRVSDKLRYTIEDWYEHQEPIYEEPTQDLWDGTL